MVIDVISYTDAQFAALSDAQVLEVQEAQLKKNRLYIQLEEAKRKEKYRLMKNGVFLSKIWQLYCEKLQREYEAEVENIRESLLFYLRFTSKNQGGGLEGSAPYAVDYSLTVEERFTVVRGYYEGAFTNPKERFDAFKADEIAVVYLGELYASLYDYFAELAR